MISTCLRTAKLSVASIRPMRRQLARLGRGDSLSGTTKVAVRPMISIGKKRELRTHWQRVCKPILAKEDVLTVSRALELTPSWTYRESRPIIFSSL
jgi:hypothetical protein